MLYPIGAKIPSESTIEYLGNHFILSLIGDPHTWIYTPSRREELRLGFDAQMQNYKVAVIQYKKLQPPNQNGSLRISIDPGQHRTLTSTYGKGIAYYAFATYDSYARLNADFLGPGSPWPFVHTVFLDAHDLPPNTTSVRLDRNGDMSANTPGRGRGPAVRYWDGPWWVAELRACNIGQPLWRAAEIQLIDLPSGVPIPRVSVLMYHMGGKR